MAKKDTKEVTKEILDVEFDNTSKAMDFDDDGYEEGKSKEREMVAQGPKVIDIKDKLLFKEAQDKGLNMRKMFKNKKISDLMGKRKFNKLKEK
jgi:hypothetical protein|tara:strand:+ start:89 stop:367 length:279 start_codon:yes stop_codon:yes gene_type:complete